MVTILETTFLNAFVKENTSTLIQIALDIVP